MSDTTLSFNVLAKDNATRTIGKIGQSFGNLHMSVGKVMGGLVALGPALAGLAVGAGIKQFVDDARESAKVGRLTAAVIKSTGGAARLTARQVGDLATAISNKTGADDEAIQSGENLLLTFTNIRNGVGKGNDIFNQASQAITDMTAALNGGEVTAEGMKTSSIQLGKALNDPIKGVTALQKVGVSFTADQKKQIKTLVESGKTMQAQKIILKELGKEFGGAAQAASDPLTRLKTIAGNLSEQIGGYLLPAVDKFATFLGTTVIPYVSKLADQFAQKVSPKLKQFGQFVESTVLPALMKVGNFIRDNILPLVPRIVDTFTGLGSKIVHAVGEIDLAGIGDTIWTGATKWAGRLIGGWKSGLEKGDWKPLGKAIGEGITSAVQNVSAGFGKLADAIGAQIDRVDWGKLGAKISTSVRGLIAAVDWKSLGKVLGDGVVNVVEKASDLGVKLGHAFKSVIDRIDWKTIGNDSTNAIIGFVEGIDWPKVGKALGIAVLKSVKINAETYNAVINGAAQLVIGMFNALSKEIERGRLKLVGWTKKVGGDLISGLWSGIKSAMKGVGNFLKSTIVDPIITSVRSLFGVHSPSTVFARIGNDLIAGLRAGIVSAVRGIGAWIGRTVVAPVIGAFARAGSWLVQHGRNLVAGFKSGITDIARGIGRWVYDKVISPSVAPFGKAGTWLYQKGRNVISGFKNGMVSVWGDVTQWVSGIATWIKDHKGPVSLDGRLLIPAGRAIMSGFLKGLKSGAGPAWSFVKSVGGKTVSALQASIGGPFMGAGKAPTDVSGVKAVVRTLAAQRGWGSGAEWDALYNLLMGESGFNPNAQNPNSTAYGLFQFLNSTWGSVGASKTSDPWGQTAAGLKYIAMSYGDPINAYSKWSSRSPHWYEKGTPWVPSDGLAYLHKGEGVLPRKVNEARIAAARSDSGMTTVALSKEDRELVRELIAWTRAIGDRPVTLDARSFDEGLSRVAVRRY